MFLKQNSLIYTELLLDIGLFASIEKTYIADIFTEINKGGIQHGKL